MLNVFNLMIYWDVGYLLVVFLISIFFDLKRYLLKCYDFLLF